MEPNRTHRITLLMAIAAAGLTASCAGGRSGFPEVEGWTRTGDVRVYNADNLWQYIDGAAMLFVEYGIRTCTTADMTAAGVAVTVDLYEMASPLAAVGVFKRESSGGGADLAGTTVAAVSPPYQALMVKGSTYAKVNAYEGELSDAEGRRLLQGLAASIPGETATPEEFSLLPAAGKLPGSEGYQPVSLLGLTELADCLYADYEGSDGDTWQGFVVLPLAASTVWDALVGQWESFEDSGYTVLYREVPYSGLVGVTRTESGVFGVSGAADETQLRERLGRFASIR